MILSIRKTESNETTWIQTETNDRLQSPNSSQTFPSDELHTFSWLISILSLQTKPISCAFVCFLSICESFPNTGWFNSSVWAGGVSLERRRTGDDTDSTTPAVYKPDLWGPKLIELCQQVRSGLFMYLMIYYDLSC